MKNTRLISSIIFIFILSVFCSNSYSTTINISVSNYVFTPSNVSANVGDTIKWNWLNGGHTTTCNGSAFTSRPAGAAPWDAPINGGSPSFRYVITVAGLYNYKCTPHEDEMRATINAVAVPSAITLNLTALIEGFWNGTTMISDSVTVYLRSAASPFAKIDSAKALLNSAGTATLLFTRAPAGSYYIVVTHRNSIDTWSKFPVTFTAGGTVSYDFTTAADKAFGDNLKLINGRYTIFGADVTRDGLVNLNDIVLINNNASNFINGYVVSDVNGDNITNLNDILIAFNNSNLFVHVFRPGVLR